MCAKLRGIPGPIARYLGFQRSIHNFERVVLEPSLTKGEHCRLKRVAYVCSFVLQKWGFILPRMRRGIAEVQLLGYPHVSDVWILFAPSPPTVSENRSNSTHEVTNYFAFSRKTVGSPCEAQDVDFVTELHGVRSSSQLRSLALDLRRWTRVKGGDAGTRCEVVSAISWFAPSRSRVCAIGIGSPAR